MRRLKSRKVERCRGKVIKNKHKNSLAAVEGGK